MPKKCKGRNVNINEKGFGNLKNTRGEREWGEAKGSEVNNQET